MGARRAQLADLAAGLTSRFVSRNNDVDGYWGIGVLVREMRESGRRVIDFDLLGGPSPLDGGSAEWLASRLAAMGAPTGWVRQATLRVVLTPAPRILRARSLPVAATAVLIDDRGRGWIGSATTDARPHDARRELRRAGF